MNSRNNNLFNFELSAEDMNAIAGMNTKTSCFFESGFAEGISLFDGFGHYRRKAKSRKPSG
jgi:hypothetical protein